MASTAPLDEARFAGQLARDRGDLTFQLANATLPRVAGDQRAQSGVLGDFGALLTSPDSSS